MRTFILFIACSFLAMLQPQCSKARMYLPIATASSNPVAPDLARLSARDVEKITGTHLSLREKIAWRLFRKKIARQVNQEIIAPDWRERDEGAAAKTFGILSLVLLFIPYLSLLAIPFAIVAIVKGSRAKRKDPLNRKARTAITLGIVTLALLVAAITIAVIVLSGLTFTF